MKSLQEIRIDIVRMGKEIKVNPTFEEQFKKLNTYLMSEFGCEDFNILDYELDKIDNNRFECDILKCAICHAFKIPIYNVNGNPWYDSFMILSHDEPASYHGSGSGKIITKYDMRFSDTIGYKIYNLLSMSDEQLMFIKTFKEKYPIFKENLVKIKDNCFPIIIEE
jgi:hypothetical protein